MGRWKWVSVGWREMCGWVVGGLVVCTVAGWNCLGECVGGVVVCTMWACGSRWVFAGGSVWVSGWDGLVVGTMWVRGRG